MTYDCPFCGHGATGLQELCEHLARSCAYEAEAMAAGRLRMAKKAVRCWCRRWFVLGAKPGHDRGHWARHLSEGGGVAGHLIAVGLNLHAQKKD